MVSHFCESTPSVWSLSIELLVLEMARTKISNNWLCLLICLIFKIFNSIRTRLPNFRLQWSLWSWWDLLHEVEFFRFFVAAEKQCKLFWSLLIVFQSLFLLIQVPDFQRPVQGHCYHFFLLEKGGACHFGQMCVFDLVGKVASQVIANDIEKAVELVDKAEVENLVLSGKVLFFIRIRWIQCGDVVLFKLVDAWPVVIKPHLFVSLDDKLNHVLVDVVAHFGVGC